MAEYKMDISAQILKIYTKIANWHNGEQEAPCKANLQILSQEIVSDIMNFTLGELDAKTKIGIEVNEPTKKKGWFNKK